MTEKEANKKWCPMIRISIGGKACTNRGDIDKVAKLTCCASACMGWQWETLYTNMPASGRIVEDRKSTTEGYCGLARNK